MAEGSNCTRIDAIVIISSDEDDEEDVQELFRAFVSQVERYVEQNDVVLLLKLKFAEARSEFVSSAKFKSAIKWRTKQMNKANGYIYTGDICKLLLGDSKTDHSKAKLDGVKEILDHDACSAGNENVVIHSSRAEPDVNKTIIHVTIDNCEEDDSNTVIERMPAEVDNPQPSTSTVKPSISLEVKGEIKKKRKVHAATTTTKSSPAKKTRSPRKRKQLVEKLKLKLNYLGDQIKILSKAELSLEEMEMSESTYIQECRLKERFNRIYNKICKLQGHPPVTGRVTEREVKCPTTRVPEIDRAINKFLKEKKSRFPDIFDIRNVVFDANKQHGLKLPVQALNEISDEVFMCVGNKLQKRRKRDFENNFGCALTDDYQPSNDPAITDLALRKKLEENKRISKRNLDDVFNKFAHYGRMATYDHGSSSSDSDSENSKPENGRVKSAMKRKFSHISVTQSSDSSENECDDFGLEEEINDGSNPIRSEVVFDDGSTSQKHFEEKSKKKRLILKFSNTSENDLEDFAIKTPRQGIERKENIDNNNKCDTNYSIALPSKETDLSVAELPNSILSECDDSSMERTAVVELDCTLQHTEIETAREAKISEIDDVASVSEDQEVMPVQHISPSDVVSSSLQGSEAWTDSNISTLGKEDLTSQSSDPSVPSLQSQSIPSDDIISINNSDVKPEVLIDSSNVIDGQVVAEKPPKENGRQKTLPNSTLSTKSVDINLASSISIPLTPVNDRKSLFRLSTRKRKVENGSFEYESPLKILCDARLDITEMKQEASLNRTESTDQKSSCKKIITLSESENDVLSAAISVSPPVQTTTNGQSTLEKSESRRLALSLNKGRRNSPSNKQKVVERTSDVIVLSDDDSDS